MNRLVLDASATAALFLPDEDSEKIANVLTEYQKQNPNVPFLVPSIWWSEITNILLVSFRRGRIKEEEFQTSLYLLSRIPIETDFVKGTGYQNALIAIGKKEGLSAYDATYIELAERKKASLLTIDKNLDKIRKKRKIPR
ncbi:type II toxin-antitoxin system VapC family toxin [Leptospira sarikeiensis]|uniref:PIN domain-containing protein n=1 Tax=Leptospira sarikeiensis TaxID=2484943 RepID=A0A4R9KEE0_9LEPT|nr:type II toxin-antitoxin system VapC family toxin [Leptospira sarikeiensis]TGL63573.1 PIN domain-containing protein [Leptospira sarikeiensis]